MEIYKLSDEVPETRRGLTKKRKCDRMGAVASKDVRVSGGGDIVCGGADGKLKITDIWQGVRNENRVNIYVNGKYSFSLDVAQVVDMGVKIGREVTPEELEELKKASEYGKAYQRALEWALVRPRSVRELRDYLRRKNGGFDELIVARLAEKGYVDDEEFAQYYVENRFVKKGISVKRMRMELAAKGVAKEIVEAVLAESGRDEVQEIQKMIKRKRARYDDEKLIAYLCRQGFSYELVSEQVRSYGTD